MGAKQTNKTISSMSVGNPIHSVEPKTVAAVILVAVMGVLWARVLLRTGASTALAVSPAANVDLMQQESSSSDVKIRPIPLTISPGRHDAIAEDFFRADRCLVWKQQTDTAPVIEPVDEGADQRLFNEIVKAVSLEAIIKDADGNAQKACINSAIVTVGSQLQISVKNKTYAVRIVSIEPDNVQLSWQDYSIVIEMPDQKVNG